MEFRIPFTFSNIEKLKKKSRFFCSKIRYKKSSKFGEVLKDADVQLTREEYLGICLRNFIYSFFCLLVVLTAPLLFFKLKFFYLIGPGVSLLISGFVFSIQASYPRIYVARKQREIEKNLVSALEDILVQLNSGIPLFNIMVNISESNYGQLSLEFKKAVKKINAGEPESVVLDDLGKRNPSVFFRRTLWQISNGMNSGSDMATIVKDSTSYLNEEQLIQIQNYGNKLNPLIVLYMLIAVIIPTLSITFLTIISSMIGLSKTMVMVLFIGLFVFNLFFQIMFLGLIKSRRPSLL